jgi:hypothetical protein
MTIEVTLDDFLALPWRERIEVRVVRIVLCPLPSVKRERESKPFGWLNLVAIKLHHFLL